MEENTKIILLGQQRRISSKDLLNLQPLFTQENFKEIRFPTWMSQFRPELKVLHSCFYYLLAVQKNLKSCHSLEFREKCLANITEYYVRHKMNFQLYQYAYLIGKLLNVPLDKAMHIIYFLIYARLASKPFILTLIRDKEKKNRRQRKKQTRSSQKSYSMQSKERDSRHLTIFCDPSQQETQNLKKELKKIMSPQPILSKKATKRLENNKKFQSPRKANFCQDDSQAKEKKDFGNSLSYRSIATSRIVNIPVKVSSNANSSVINRLQLKSSNSRSDNNFNRAQVRRQKFNEFFDSTERYNQLFNNGESKQNMNIKAEWGTSKFIPDKDPKNLFNTIYKDQKKPYEYFQDIACNVKSKNQNLDSIRYECSHHNRNTLNPSRSTAYADWGFQMNRNSLKPETEFNRTNKGIQNSLINRTVVLQEDNKLDYLILQSDKEKYLTQKEKQLLKMNKTANQIKFFENYVGSITRRNENIGNEGESMFFFNTNIKGKSKLLKYKQEYRHFLKNQFFQREKESS